MKNVFLNYLDLPRRQIHEINASLSLCAIESSTIGCHIRG